MTAKPPIRLLCAAAITVFASVSSHPALAFDCAVTPSATTVKGTVCGTPQLRGLMKSELSRHRSLSARLKGAGDRAIVKRSRDEFEAKRDQCETRTACLRDAYRLQIRLYDQLDICAARGGPAKRCLDKTLKRFATANR